jgi:predicted nucleic acid-binding protein
MIGYVDSSVLVRLLLDEPDPFPWLADLEERVTSALTHVECLRSVDAALHVGKLDDNEYSDRRTAVFSLMRRMRLVAVSPAVLRRAGEPLPAPLRTLDAVHVATALRWRERRESDLVFVTHDRQQGGVARLLGFEVIGDER